MLKENNINMDNDKNDTKLDCCFLVPQFKCREDFGKVSWQFFKSYSPGNGNRLDSGYNF